MAVHSWGIFLWMLCFLSPSIAFSRKFSASPNHPSIPYHALIVNKSKLVELQQRLRKHLKLASMVSTGAATTSQDAIDKLIANGPVPVNERIFMVNGWRWHTMAILRDLGRFQALVDRLELQSAATGGTSPSPPSCKERLESAYQFTLQFNWNSLRKVEATLFFPWLKAKLPPLVSEEVQRIAALHQRVDSLSHKVQHACHTTDYPSLKHSLQELVSCAQQIQHIQV